MANPEILNVDVGSVVIARGPMRDELVTFTAAATYLPGTILARDTVTFKMVAYVKNGVTNGNGVANSVLTETLVATAAGDKPARIMQNGTVDKSRLIILADGNATNVNHIEIDGLRERGIYCQDMQDLSVKDNQ